jgi:hypothetical protein
LSISEGKGEKAMKTSCTTGALCIGVCLGVAIGLRPGLRPGRLHAESYPDFSKAYWEDGIKKAKAKIWRGAALGVLGVASIAPTTILTLKAVEDPKRYLAYAAFSGIATLGMSFHGFFSIGYGRYQRDKAERFAALYDTEPSAVNADDESAYYTPNGHRLRFLDGHECR